MTACIYLEIIFGLIASLLYIVSPNTELSKDQDKREIIKSESQTTVNSQNEDSSDEMDGDMEDRLTRQHRIVSSATHSRMSLDDIDNPLTTKTSNPRRSSVSLRQKAFLPTDSINEINQENNH